jgi:UPF0755 protein
MSMNSAAEALAREGIIDHPTWFYYYARATKQTTLKAGEYEIPPHATPEQVLKILLSGQVVQLSVTIPEGLNSFEIFKIIEDAGLGNARDLQKECESKAFIAAMELPGPTCEGYLFPETYRFARHLPAKTLLSGMMNLFKKNFTKEIESAGAKVGLSPREIVTLASIIQKETGIDSEMPHISSVFHNRLAKNMRLETDPTVIYAEILDTGRFDGDISYSDLRREHPYNTYKNTGLPPGPIASPGKKALDAAVHPDNGRDLFFVATGDGGHEFCPTYDCHLKATERYLRKLRGKK